MSIRFYVVSRGGTVLGPAEGSEVVEEANDLVDELRHNGVDAYVDANEPGEQPFEPPPATILDRAVARRNRARALGLVVR